ncbi:MAG: hypothetical protein U0234_25135 [Sandaracinus sp.]
MPDVPDGSEPDEREGAVPVGALEALLRALDRCGGHGREAPLVDLDEAARVARRFKLDVSFDFAPQKRARFSLNDKGEPAAFRARLRRALPAMGIDAQLLDRFLAIAAPGRVQTTVGVKWSADASAPERVSLYFEELYRDPAHAQIRDDVFALVGLEAPPVPEGARPVSVCIDCTREGPVALKSYDVLTDTPTTRAREVPPSLEEAVASLPFHPIHGARRYMIATRRAPTGRDLGHKLLWITEVHRPSLARWAWDQVDAWRRRWGTDVHPDVARALDELRGDPTFDDATFLYPDLVGLNTDASSEPRLLVYVSVR